MAIALDPNELFDFVLPEDAESDGPTVFHLSSLTASEAVRAMDLWPEHEEAGQMPPGTAQEILTAAEWVLSRKLRGWKNLRKSEGGTFEFSAGEKGGASRESLDVLRFNWIVQLAGAVMERINMGASEGESLGS